MMTNTQKYADMLRRAKKNSFGYLSPNWFYTDKCPIELYLLVRAMTPKMSVDLAHFEHVLADAVTEAIEYLETP
jgi:hypothetical protein